MKSAYIVELSVMPGGARRGNLLVCTTPAHVRAILAWEYVNGWNDTEGEDAYPNFSALS